MIIEVQTHPFHFPIDKLIYLDIIIKLNNKGGPYEKAMLAIGFLFIIYCL